VLQRKDLAGRGVGEKVTGQGGKMLGELPFVAQAIGAPFSSLGKLGKRARPADASGMSRKPDRDAKNAQKAHIKGEAPAMMGAGATQQV
jgi:hypothetical protein